MAVMDELDANQPFRTCMHACSPSTTTDVLVGLDAVNDALLSGDAQFADARSIGEYTGASANGNLRAGAYAALSIA